MLGGLCEGSVGRQFCFVSLFVSLCFALVCFVSCCSLLISFPSLRSYDFSCFCSSLS